MKKRVIVVISLLVTVLFFGLPQSNDLFSQADHVILEDWQRYTGHPFSVWRTRDDVSRARAVYRIVEEDGKKFLRASTVTTNN